MGQWDVSSAYFKALNLTTFRGGTRIRYLLTTDSNTLKTEMYTLIIKLD